MSNRSQPIGDKELLEAIEERSEMVGRFLKEMGYAEAVAPPLLRELVGSYPARGGKRLRPALLMLCAGAVGGDEREALGAAAAVELFHTWTLVHDDIIDRDERRRGGPTVHVEATRKIARRWRLSQETAAHYGRSAAILTGDVQHGWAVWALGASATGRRPAAETVLALTQEMEGPVLRRLVEGEMLDVELGHRRLDRVTLREILRMLRLKTGTLYEFAAGAGAAIGLRTGDLGHPTVESLARFGSECGLAFQLQDDLLGVVGDAATLGKPVGSDIREGKRTTLVYYGWRAASRAQRTVMRRVLGDARASQAGIARVTELFRDLKAVGRTEQLARRAVGRGVSALSGLPDSRYRRLLEAWAGYLVARQA